MFKIYGVNMFPALVEEMLAKVDGATSEYRVTLARDDDNNKDVFLLTVEGEGRVSFENMAKEISYAFKTYVGATPKVTIVPIGTLPRSEKKTKRVTDLRSE